MIRVFTGNGVGGTIMVRNPRQRAIVHGDLEEADDCRTRMYRGTSDALVNPLESIRVYSENGHEYIGRVKLDYTDSE